VRRTLALIYTELVFAIVDGRVPLVILKPLPTDVIPYVISAQDQLRSTVSTAGEMRKRTSTANVNVYHSTKGQIALNTSPNYTLSTAIIYVDLKAARAQRLTTVSTAARTHP